jgi:hypothetical protein
MKGVAFNLNRNILSRKTTKTDKDRERHTHTHTHRSVPIYKPDAVIQFQGDNVYPRDKFVSLPRRESPFHN